MEKKLMERSDSKCELCGSTDDLKVYHVPPVSDKTVDNSILTCGVCFHQLENPEDIDPNHWRCLNDSMWSPVPAVQVVAYRMLNALRSEGWSIDLLDMMYMDEDTEKWAKAMDNAVQHVDSNGVKLQAGDTVVLIKDLKVKGTSMVAKRGTAVRRISLVADNAEHIEGKVEGQRIVILTQFVKKSK